MYRTLDIIIYVGKKVISGTLKITITRVIRNVIIMGMVIGINCLVGAKVTNWLEWFLYAMRVGVISMVLFLTVNTCFETQMTKKVFSYYRKDCKEIIMKKNILFIISTLRCGGAEHAISFILLNVFDYRKI